MASLDEDREGSADQRDTVRETNLPVKISVTTNGNIDDTWDDQTVQCGFEEGILTPRSARKHPPSTPTRSKASMSLDDEDYNDEGFDDDVASVASGADKKTLKILMYGRAHKGPRRRRRRKGGANGDDDQSVASDSDNRDELCEGDGPGAVMPNCEKSQSMGPEIYTYMNMDNDNQETNDNASKKKKRKKKKKIQRSDNPQGFLPILEEVEGEDDAVGSDSTDKRGLSRSRLPLVNAEETASLAALSVLGGQDSPDRPRISEINAVLGARQIDSFDELPLPGRHEARSRASSAPGRHVVPYSTLDRHDSRDDITASSTHSRISSHLGVSTDDRLSHEFLANETQKAQGLTDDSYLYSTSSNYAEDNNFAVSWASASNRASGNTSLSQMNAIYQHTSLGAAFGTQGPGSTLPISADMAVTHAQSDSAGTYGTGFSPTPAHQYQQHFQEQVDQQIHAGSRYQYSSQYGLHGGGTRRRSEYAPSELYDRHPRTPPLPLPPPPPVYPQGGQPSPSTTPHQYDVPGYMYYYPNAQNRPADASSVSSIGGEYGHYDNRLYRPQASVPNLNIPCEPFSPTHRDGNRSPMSAKDETHELELLVLDLAKALPNPESLRLPQTAPYFSPRPYSQSASWSDAGESVETRSSMGQSSTSGYHATGATGAFATGAATTASSNNIGTLSSSASMNGSVKEGQEVLANYYKLYDVDRETRVARAIQMAEAERARRVKEILNDRLQEKLERARRLEWAIKATEAERQRQTRRDKAFERRANRRRRVLKEWTIRQEEVERNRRIKRGAGADIVLREARRKTRAEARRAKRAGLDKDGIAKSSPALLPSESSLRPGDDGYGFASLKDSANYLSDLDSDLDSMSSSSSSDDGYSPYTDNYEVVCPYTILGCEMTCQRSELDEHLSQCKFRESTKDLVDDHANEEFANLYNPLDFIVACPYRVMGCEHECSRAMLPEHLIHCPYHDEDTGPIDMDRYTLTQISSNTVDMERYEIVCPYSMMGCTDIILRSEYAAHLAVCPFAPATRQQEEADRIKNMEMAIEAAEVERKRRLTLSPEENERMRSQHFNQLLRALIEARLINLEREGDESSDDEVASIDAVVSRSGARRLASTDFSSSFAGATCTPNIGAHSGSSSASLISATSSLSMSSTLAGENFIDTEGHDFVDSRVSSAAMTSFDDHFLSLDDYDAPISTQSSRSSSFDMRGYRPNALDHSSAPPFFERRSYSLDEITNLHEEQDARELAAGHDNLSDDGVAIESTSPVRDPRRRRRSTGYVNTQGSAALVALDEATGYAPSSPMTPPLSPLPQSGSHHGSSLSASSALFSPMLGSMPRHDLPPIHRQAHSLNSLDPAFPADFLRRGSSFDAGQRSQHRDQLINSKNLTWIFKAAEIEALRQKVELRAMERAMGGGGSGSARRKGFVLPMRRIRSCPAMLNHIDSQESPTGFTQQRHRVSSLEEAIQEQNTSGVHRAVGLESTGGARGSRAQSAHVVPPIRRYGSFKMRRERAPSGSSQRSFTGHCTVATTGIGSDMSTNGSLRSNRGIYRNSAHGSFDATLTRGRVGSQASELSIETAGTSSSVISAISSSPMQASHRHYRSRSLGCQEDNNEGNDVSHQLDDGEPLESPRALSHRTLSSSFSSQAYALGSPHAHSLHDHMDGQMRNLHRHLRFELTAYADKCAKENPDYEKMIMDIISRIEHEASLCFGQGIRAELFGSYASGLAVPELSDVDLVLFSNQGRLDVNGASICNILGRVIRHKDWVKNIKILDRAKMPVIKLQTDEDVLGRCVNVDLTIALPSHAGQRAAEFLRSLVKTHEQLRPLVLTLKRFLVGRGLHDPFSGGLSSYALVLMTVASLNRSVDRRLRRPRRRSDDLSSRDGSSEDNTVHVSSAIGMSSASAAQTQTQTQAKPPPPAEYMHPSHQLSLGLLFMDFLQFYGRDFIPSQEAVLTVVSMANKDSYTTCIGPRFHAASSPHAAGDYIAMLVVDDPVQTGNNVGRTCFRVAEVQRAFADLYANLLSYTVRCETIRSSSSRRGILERLLFAK